MNITEEILDFLLLRDWQIEKESDLFYYLLIPEIFSGEHNFTIKLPKFYNAPDYNDCIEKILSLMEKVYPRSFKHPRGLIKKFKKQNEHQKRKFLKKEFWIEPDFKSRIEKMNIHEIYVPLEE